MQLTLDDFALLVYNYAVVLSGGWLVYNFEVPDRWFLFLLMVPATIVWTIYFRYQMQPRFEPDDEEQFEPDEI